MLQATTRRPVIASNNAVIIKVTPRGDRQAGKKGQREDFF